MIITQAAPCEPPPTSPPSCCRLWRTPAQVRLFISVKHIIIIIIIIIMIITFFYSNYNNNNNIYIYIYIYDLAAELLPPLANPGAGATFHTAGLHNKIPA